MIIVNGKYCTKKYKKKYEEKWNKWNGMKSKE